MMENTTATIPRAHMLTLFGKQKSKKMSLDAPIVDINGPHPSVTERYYTPKYKIGMGIFEVDCD